MYQLHYTLNNLTTSYSDAVGKLNNKHKIIQHYNICNEIKHYELLTSKNSETLPLIADLPLDYVRVKLETTDRPKEFIYIEKHFKMNYIPNLPKSKYVMLTQVINPKHSHKYIVTIRAKSEKTLKVIEDSLDFEYIKVTTEYCIIDTNEKLDYIHY